MAPAASALEQALAAANAEPGRRPEFFRVLLDSEVFVIVDGREPGVTGRVRVAAGEKLRLRGTDVNGIPHVFLFSSLENLVSTAGGPAAYVAGPARGFFGMMGGTAAWLDPGKPMTLFLSGAQVQDLAAGRIPCTPAEVEMRPDQASTIRAPERVPERLVEVLGGFLRTRREVRAAYLAQCIDPGDGTPPHALIAIDATGDVDELIRSVGLVLEGALGQGEIVDFLPLGESSISEAIVARGRRIYRRKRFGLF